MNRPFSTGMSVFSAIRRADVFSRGLVSAGQRSNEADDRVNGDTLYTATQMRRQADDRRNPIHLVSLQINGDL
jgi:hypothetical protein